VISVDTKKKELIGEYKNAGSDYRPQGVPIDVNVYDFVDKQLASHSYGVYDVGGTPVASASASSRHRRIRGQRHSSLARGDGRERYPTCIGS